MVRTRSRATSPSHQESRDASSHPQCDRQSAPVMPQSSVQHLHSMAATMAELTQQNQELTREINSKKQHHEGYAEGQAQSQEDRGDAEPESQSRGTTSRRVPQLEREMDQMRKVMAEMRENMRRTNPVEELVHRTDSPFTASVNGHPLPQSSKCVHWIRTMKHAIPLIILQHSRLPCTFRESRMRLCVGLSLLLSKGQRECGSAKYPLIQ